MKIPALHEHAALVGANRAAATWSLQEAKDNFSKVVKAAAFEPQSVAVHGKTKAVIVEVEQFKSLQRAALSAAVVPSTWSDWLQSAGPGADFSDDDMDTYFGRDRSPSHAKAMLDGE